MSTATSVISTSPRGPSFEGTPGRAAAPGGASAAEGAQAVGFAGLLFSRLEAVPGERSGPARDGETLPAGGDGLPGAQRGVDARKGEAAEESRAEVVTDPAELEKTEAQPASSPVASVDQEEAALEEVALEEMTGEVALALEGEVAAPEARGEGADPESAVQAETKAETLAEVDLEGEVREQGAGAEGRAGEAGAGESDTKAADSAAVVQSERLQSADTVARGGASAEAGTDRGTPAPSAGQAAAPESAAQPAQAPGLAQAAAVAAESSALHTGVPGQERVPGEAAAVARAEAAGAGRNQVAEGALARGEAQSQALAAEAGDDAEAEGEAQSRREQASGRGGNELPSQKDGAGKAEFVLPSAKELTFENPFRSLGLGAAEATGRGQGAGSSPAPSLAQLQQTYQGSATGTTSLAVAERFGSPQWGGGVNQRIMWMANQQVGRAELRLDPPELGSLTVRLNISHDQASVSFVSPHAHVRDALEQQMPRLREMLAENGLNLQEADVSDQSTSRDSGEARDEQARGGGGRGGAGEAEDEGLMEAPRRASLALVDFYA